MVSGVPWEFLCVWRSVKHSLGFKCSGHWFCRVRPTSMKQMGNNDKEGVLGRMGQDLRTLDAVSGSGTSSLGDLLQVSWPLWVSSSNERTDLEALKPWESNLQFYSDTVSIRLTFPPHGPFLREYIITLRLPNKLNTKPDAVNSARGINRRLGLHFVISSLSMMTSYHRKSWPSEDQERVQPWR